MTWNGFCNPTTIGYTAIGLPPGLEAKDSSIPPDSYILSAFLQKVKLAKLVQSYFRRPTYHELLIKKSQILVSFIDFAYFCRE